MKTIKQIADEIGVTRQAVYQKIKRNSLMTHLQEFIKIDKDIVYINADGENIIKEIFSKKQKNHTQNQNEYNKPVNTVNTFDGAVNKNDDLFTPTVNTFRIDSLRNVKGNNGQYTALCPAHDDNNNSLSVKITNDRVLLYCHAGCSTESIVSALGLPMTALFTDDKPQKIKAPKYKTNTITYEYRTEDGSLAYRKQRYEFSDGSKSFGFFQPNGEKGRGGQSYPYNLTDVLNAETVYFCEGEKCVEAIKKAGRVATSLDAGANSKWQNEYNAYFEGKNVIILPDNDEPGLKYAFSIKKELPDAVIKELPGLPEKGDIFDWLKLGHNIEEIDDLPDFDIDISQTELSEISVEDLPGFIDINPFTPEKKNRYRWDDIGTSNHFADSYKNICRYCPEAKSWYIYDGKVWKIDVGGVVTSQYGKAFTFHLLDCRKHLNDDNQRENWIKYVAKRIQKKSRDIMISDASSVYPVSIHKFDKDINLLNVQNGTIDLQNFKLKPHNPDDLLSKIANVSYNETAKCDRWERFITEIMQDDTDKAEFLQKALGYALTGDTSEECFFIFYGNTTRNGKGTTAETALHILGDYGRTAQPETVAQKQNSSGSGPSEDVARLKGARFVNMSEPDKGLRLNAALVKSMTGGDTITARFLHQNSFEFRPEYKLFINTNHLPRVNDDSIFASGRVKLIPFERHFPENEQDKGLKSFFRQPQNKSGILNWLLTGLQLLKENGLKQPKAVLDATAQYREDSDVIGQFINECLFEKSGYNTQLKNVHDVYESWCKDNGNGVLNSHNLSAELKKKGKKIERGAKNKVYLFDYALISDREDIPPE